MRSHIPRASGFNPFLLANLNKTQKMSHKITEQKTQAAWHESPVTPFVITVPADAWNAYQRAKAIASAAAKDAEQLGEACGIPEAQTLAAKLGLNPGDKGECVIQDGNARAIGKLALFYHPGMTIGPGWRKRVS